MTYIYNGTIFKSGDDIICRHNDVLEINIDINYVHNLSNNSYFTLTYKAVDKLLTECKRVHYINYEDKTSQNPIIPKLIELGILHDPEDDRDYNIGNSDYSEHVIQPWSIWMDYNLNAWDADIVKRILRTKKEEGKNEKESRIMDYEKIIHICKERIRQLKY